MSKPRSRREFEDRWLTYHDLDFSEPICNNCVHRLPDSLGCKAYPDIIPDEILNNDVDHRKPYIGDNGIVFEKKA